jgi:hypothetical protein
MKTVPTPICLYCERVAAVSARGLCADCHTSPRIRLLYRRRHGWTPQWELHLRRLTQRARLRLPLFDDEPTS